MVRTMHSRGVSVLISSELAMKIDDILIDENGRFIFIKGEMQGVKLLLGNFYFPTRDKEEKNSLYF